MLGDLEGMCKGDNGLISNSDISTFPPTNWSVWYGQKWIPDDKVKIATGDEVTKFKPCQKIVISFDKKHKDFSKIHKEHLGNYTPIMDSYSYGRPKFQNENTKIQLSVNYNGQWATTYTDGSLKSVAAGDMNPASERNSQCKGCNMTAWVIVYETDASDSMEWLQSDKLKVSCEENIDEEVSGDWHDVEESEKENTGTEETEETEETERGITTEVMKEDYESYEKISIMDYNGLS